MCSTGNFQTLENNRKTMKTIENQQDKYTMDPGQSTLSQHKEKMFWWSKMIFEQKQIRKMHKSCIIND